MSWMISKVSWGGVEGWDILEDGQGLGLCFEREEAALGLLDAIEEAQSIGLESGKVRSILKFKTQDWKMTEEEEDLWYRLIGVAGSLVWKRYLWAVEYDIR